MVEEEDTYNNLLDIVEEMKNNLIEVVPDAYKKSMEIIIEKSLDEDIDDYRILTRIMINNINKLKVNLECF